MSDDDGIKVVLSVGRFTVDAPNEPPWARDVPIPDPPHGSEREKFEALPPMDFPPGSGETKDARLLREAYKLMRMAWWLMIVLLIGGTVVIFVKSCERECPRCVTVERPIP